MSNNLNKQMAPQFFVVEFRDFDIEPIIPSQSLPAGMNDIPIIPIRSAGVFNSNRNKVLM